MRDQSNSSSLVGITSPSNYYHIQSLCPNLFSSSIKGRISEPLSNGCTATNWLLFPVASPVAYQSQQHTASRNGLAYNLRTLTPTRLCLPGLALIILAKNLSALRTLSSFPHLLCRCDNVYSFSHGVAPASRPDRLTGVQDNVKGVCNIRQD